MRGIETPLFSVSVGSDAAAAAAADAPANATTRSDEEDERGIAPVVGDQESKECDDCASLSNCNLAQLLPPFLCLAV
jgi:hypothetical protein